MDTRPNTKSLRAKRARKYRQMPRSSEVIRGTLVLVRRSCGQKNCRCHKGLKHASWYLSQSRKGKTKMIYLSKDAVEKVRQCTQRHQKIKGVLEELSEINLALLTQGNIDGSKEA